MNITTAGKRNLSSGKRIKAQHIAMAAGIALAIGLVVSRASSSQSPNASPAMLASSNAVYSHSTAPQQYFYVVSDEAARDVLRAAILDAQVATDDVSTASYNSRVVVAGTDDERALFTYEFQEMAALDGRITIIDMTRSKDVAQVRTVADADIEASVLSTELANFPVRAQRVASDADIMASVLSTERAAFGN